MVFAALCLVCGFFVASFAAEQEAKSAGFESHAERTLALSHDISDPVVWQERRAELVVEVEETNVVAPPNRTRAEEERRKGFHCLSKRDGSHQAFKEEFIKSLRDPDSFKHVETKVTPVSDTGTHQIYMEYRAKNGFGGMNAGIARGYYDTKTCAHVLLALE